MNDPLRKAVERLRAAGIESARADARILWRHARETPNLFASFVRRRASYEPVAYITGHKEFWSLDFEVGPGVLVPRPDTETLVEVALAALPDEKGAYRVLDLGTGTGCLLVAFLKERPRARGVGLDSCGAALVWATRNVARHGLEQRVQLLKGTWEEETADNEVRFDVVLSNPPYIPTAALTDLPRDVRDYEPQSALDGGADGLDAYRALAPVLRQNLKTRGLGLLEIGVGQHHMVAEIMAAEGLKVSRISPDLAGIPRCISIRL